MSDGQKIVPVTPKRATIHLSNGKEVEFVFGELKPAKSGNLNAHAGGKMEAEGIRFQVGINATVLE